MTILFAGSGAGSRAEATSGVTAELIEFGTSLGFARQSPGTLVADFPFVFGTPLEFRWEISSGMRFTETSRYGRGQGASASFDFTATLISVEVLCVPGATVTIISDDGLPTGRRITATPSNSSNSSSASFSFTASLAGSSFECQLDAGGFAACTSPKSYSGLSDGSHIFQVRAMYAGIVDPSPAGYTWTVDTTPPETTLTAGPTGTIQESTTRFSWSGTDNGTHTASLLYAFRLDPLEASFSAFSSATSKTYTGLANGAYTFLVKARDQALNEDPPPPASGSP